MTLVIGIDPGTATTGYGLVRDLPDDNLQMVEFGVIQTPAGLPAAERLSLLYHRLRELLLLHRPESAAV
ncbi:MAG: crossover junction endodeoxyribonuclease RuvC, partial [Anaerolineales bacterium]|nr:crossover junction endodeoxyribonuclease RuvC [Anaerolineales bacterium]